MVSTAVEFASVVVGSAIASVWVSSAFFPVSVSSSSVVIFAFATAAELRRGWPHANIMMPRRMKFESANIARLMKHHDLKKAAVFRGNFVFPFLHSNFGLTHRLHLEWHFHYGVRIVDFEPRPILSLNSIAT